MVDDGIAVAKAWHSFHNFESSESLKLLKLIPGIATAGSASTEMSAMLQLLLLKCQSTRKKKSFIYSLKYIQLIFLWFYSCTADPMGCRMINSSCSDAQGMTSDKNWSVKTCDFSVNQFFPAHPPAPSFAWLALNATGVHAWYLVLIIWLIFFCYFMHSVTSMSS